MLDVAATGRTSPAGRQSVRRRTSLRRFSVAPWSYGRALDTLRRLPIAGCDSSLSSAHDGVRGMARDHSRRHLGCARRRGDRAPADLARRAQTQPRRVSGTTTGDDRRDHRRGQRHEGQPVRRARTHGTHRPADDRRRRCREPEHLPTPPAGARSAVLDRPADGGRRTMPRQDADRVRPVLRAAEARQRSGGRDARLASASSCGR